jgi:hypothetical protein
VRSGVVDCIGHPTGRIIGARATPASSTWGGSSRSRGRRASPWRSTRSRSGSTFPTSPAGAPGRPG